MEAPELPQAAATTVKAKVWPAWTVVESTYGDDFLDWQLNPVNHLVMTSAPGTSYTLLTALQAVSTGSKPVWTVEANSDGSVTARSGDAEHVTDPDTVPREN